METLQAFIYILSDKNTCQIFSCMPSSLFSFHRVLWCVSASYLSSCTRLLAHWSFMILPPSLHRLPVNTVHPFPLLSHWFKSVPSYLWLVVKVYFFTGLKVDVGWCCRIQTPVTRFVSCDCCNQIIKVNYLSANDRNLDHVVFFRDIQTVQ